MIGQMLALDYWNMNIELWILKYEYLDSVEWFHQTSVPKIGIFL